MSEAPKEIWAHEDGDDGSGLGYWADNSAMYAGDQWHYIRADLHEALAAELARVKAQRDRLVDAGNMVSASINSSSWGTIITAHDVLNTAIAAAKDTP